MNFKGFKIQLLALTLGVGAQNLAFAYNADEHEARIRRNCNGATSWEERMGCFNGDITMIEQIRRRERLEMRARRAAVRPSNPDFDSAPTRPAARPAQRPAAGPVLRPAAGPVLRPEARPNIADIPVEADETGPAPVLTRPKKPVAAAPAKPAQIAAPSDDPFAGKPIVITKIDSEITTTIGAPLPAKPVVVAPAQPIKTEGKNETVITKTPPATPESRKPVILNPSVGQEKPAEQTVAKPAQKKADDQPKEVAAVQPEQKPEEKPAIPTTFTKKCASTAAEMERHPELKAAMSRILGIKPMKQGDQREIPMSSRRLDIGWCFGGPGGSLDKCKDYVQDDTPMRIRQNHETGRIQSYISDQWVNVKTCSDGKKIVSEFQLTKSGYTFNLKNVIERKNGKLTAILHGAWTGDPENYAVLNNGVLGPVEDQGNTRLVAGQARIPRGRN